jgi:Lon protease-like protein
MINSNLTLPVFPLPIFMLPGGITRLRIFEPRYLKMVKIALKNQGFVICLNSKEKKLTDIQWGSWVDIINFDQGDDGVLEIYVKCKSLVELSLLIKDEDNLHFANVNAMPHWSDDTEESSVQLLSESLQQVFESDMILDDLYSEKKMNNATWVISRWLELLPVNLAVKDGFVVDLNFDQAKSFVQSIMFKDH